MQETLTNRKHAFLPETHHKPFRNMHAQAAVEILVICALSAKMQMADKDPTDVD